MNKLLKFCIILVISTLTASLNLNAKVPDDILKGLKTGNASLLAKSFNQNIELVVVNNENVYSKAHAKQVLIEFFKNYPPSDFKVIHAGGKGESQYAIGNLITEKEKFRVYFLIKTNNNQPLIHQLRIEKQNN